MRKMANSFNCSLPDLENEVIQLILNGQIQARIDSENKVIFLLMLYLKNLIKRLKLLGPACARNRSQEFDISKIVIIRSRIYAKFKSAYTASCCFKK